MTSEKLAEIKARCEAAKVGPWTYIQLPSQRRHGIQSSDGGSVFLFSHPGFYSNEHPNETFAACARQDIPDLLDYIEELERRNGNENKTKR